MTEQERQEQPQERTRTSQVILVDESGVERIPVEEVLAEDQRRPRGKGQPQSTRPDQDKALLVGVELRNRPGLLPLQDSLDELERLAETAGLKVVGRVTQRLNHPNPKTYVGKGKLREIRALLQETGANVVIFDDELSPRHQRELEKFFGENVRVLDRTVLILDIFAQHAHTREGALQVELAQHQYRLPRLTRAWTHLARQAGGGGGRAGKGVGLRGPGEKQLEMDRRAIKRRIAQLKRELEEVRAHRARYRARRRKHRLPVVSLVGYTNAGKSTLLNRLAQANVYVADQLFATLDPTTRRVELPGGHVALITDTVGFIQKLPTTLVAAFRATLEEIAEADLLLHVIDLSHPNAAEQAVAVLETLKEIHADHIPMVYVFNKVDKLPKPDAVQEALKEHDHAVAISALHGIGIDRLLEVISRQLFAMYTPVEVLLPYTEGQLISLFHETGHIEVIEHRREGVYIKGRLPGRALARFAAFRLDGQESQTPVEEESFGSAGTLVA